MEISLEKIDIIRERTGLSYKEAKQILEKHEGNVVDALIDIEEGQKTWSDNFVGKGDEILQRLKDALRKGNVTKILIKKNDEIIMNIPVTAGAIGAILSPPVTTVGVAAALMSGCTLEIVKENGEVVNLSEMAEKTVEKVRKAARRESGTMDSNNSMNSGFESNDDIGGDGNKE